MTEILVPPLGESVSSATVARWLKKAGEAVAADEPLVELETDKVTVEVNAPAGGVIEAIAANEGAEVGPGAVLGTIAAGGAAAAAKPASTGTPTAPTPAPQTPAAPHVEA
uniref:biotin/lipoyl-containing protein n=1 Tax=Falsiroseomonas oryzae TaxID=2766473 RepID=UPI002FDBCF31